VLQIKEVKRMVAVTFRQLDVNDGGSICCHEFINSCLAGEQITVDIMARFFDDDASVGLVRKSLDSSWHQRRESFSDLDRCSVSQENKRKIAKDALSETSNDDDSSKASEHEEEAANQHHMRKCSPRRGKSTGSAALENVIAQLRALQNAGWEKRLTELESLGIEGRLRQLESADVVRFGIRLGPDDSGNFEPHRMAEKDSMPATVTTDLAALDTMQRDSKVPAEINDIEARVCKLDDAMTELQRACESQATQLMDVMHWKSAALARESSKQLRLEVADLQQRLDAASHELRVRCQILERHYRSLARPTSLGPSAVPASRRASFYNFPHSPIHTTCTSV